MINKHHPLYQADLETIVSFIDTEEFNGKSFLITGANGLIGVVLIDALMFLSRRGRDIEIYAAVRNIEKAKERLGEHFECTNFHLIEQDVRRALPSALSVDYIVPLASNTHPLAYSQYPVETIEINVEGAVHALNKAVECGAIVLYPSTVEIYGNANGEVSFNEDYTGRLDLSTSRACYTESKRLCEAMCQSYITERGANVKIVRLSRIFGATMDSADSKASSQFIQKALSKENIVLKSKGNQYFSYTYVADVVKAMFYVLLYGETGVPYNVSSEFCNVHLKDFASLCAQWCGKEVVFDLPTETESKGYSIAQQAILDNNRLKQLGWHSEYEFENALYRTLRILSDTIE